MEQQRAILTKKLAVLLGFEDGAEDVLQHLLTIESSEVRAVHFDAMPATTDSVKCFPSVNVIASNVASGHCKKLGLVGLRDTTLGFQS
jgi:hypothetical protein